MSLKSIIFICATAAVVAAVTWLDIHNLDKANTTYQAQVERNRLTAAAQNGGRIR